jgi:hypothetical protein
MMPLCMQMKGLRRNDDAMKNFRWYSNKIEKDKLESQLVRR